MTRFGGSCQGRSGDECIKLRWKEWYNINSATEKQANAFIADLFPQISLMAREESLQETSPDTGDVDGEGLDTVASDIGFFWQGRGAKPKTV